MKGQKKKIVVITLIMTLILGVVVQGAVGSEDDPLISLSYIENVLMPYIDQVATPAEDPGFIVVELNSGDSLEAFGGSEIILRSGDAKVVIPSSASGGFTDVTKGADIVNGEKIETNHLLICPRSDGRKIKASSKVYLMIRGGFEIK